MTQSPGLGTGPHGEPSIDRDHLLRLLMEQAGAPVDHKVLKLREGRATLWDRLHEDLLPHLHERDKYRLSDEDFCEAMLLRELFLHHYADTESVRGRVHVVRGTSPAIDEAFWAAVTKLETLPYIKAERPEDTTS